MKVSTHFVSAHSPKPSTALLSFTFPKSARIFTRSGPLARLVQVQPMPAMQGGLRQVR